MSDPFDSESNPFADPSVQNASTGETDTPEMYNPFEADTNYGAYSNIPASDSQPKQAGGPPEPANSAKSPSNANANAGSEGKKKKEKKPKKTEEVVEEDDPWGENKHVGASNAVMSSNLSPEDFAIREANMKRREQQLLEREKKLEERERLARAQGMQPNNWPFKCWSITYHSIEDEIPHQHQSAVRQLYYTMYLTWLQLLLNWVAVFAQWVTKDAGGEGIYTLWAVVYLALGVPGSWALWYRTVYFAIRDTSGTKWAIFFFNFLCHTIFCMVMAIGVPQTAACGFIVMIDLFNNNFTGLGILALVSTFIWTIIASVSIFLLKKAHTIWKVTGAEEETKKEVAKVAVKQSVK